MKKLLLFLSIFFVPYAMAANTATINGTIADSSGTTWNFASWQAVLVGTVNAHYKDGTPVITTVNGYLSSGVISGTLGRNDMIADPNTTWTFTICPFTSSPCQTVAEVVISSASVDVSTFINARLVPISILSQGATISAFNNAEISSPTNSPYNGQQPTAGQISYNITSDLYQYWSTKNQAWENFINGSGACVPSTSSYMLEGTSTGCTNSQLHEATSGAWTFGTPADPIKSLTISTDNNAYPDGVFLQSSPTGGPGHGGAYYSQFNGGTGDNEWVISLESFSTADNTTEAEIDLNGGISKDDGNLYLISPSFLGFDAYNNKYEFMHSSGDQTSSPITSNLIIDTSLLPNTTTNYTAQIMATNGIVCTIGGTLPLTLVPGDYVAIDATGKFCTQITPPSIPLTQFKTVAGCTTPVGTGQSCPVTITWDKPFTSSSSYGVTCSGNAPFTGGSASEPNSVALTGEQNQTATTVQAVTTSKGSGQAASFSTITCIGVGN